MQEPAGDTHNREPVVTRRSLLATTGTALGTMVLPTVTGQSADGDGWYGYGRDHRNSAANLESGEIVEQPTKQWDLNVKSAVRSGIAVADGNVYAFGSNGDVYAVDDDENVQVFAVGATDGSTSADGIAETRTATPLIDDGALFVGGLDGSAYAIDTNSQSELWSEEIGDTIRASPKAADGTVMIATMGGTVAALDGVSGSQEWSATVDGQVLASPALSDPILCVGDSSGTVTGLREDTGETVWTREVGTAITAAPTLSRDRIFVATMDGTVVALTHARGDPDWDRSLPDPVVASPALANEAGSGLYVSDREGTVTALDPVDGTEQWQSSTSGQIVSDPVVSEDSLYLATQDGTVLALERDDGSQRWSLDLDGTVVAPLTIADGSLYVGTTDGHIISITGDSGLVTTLLSYAEAGIDFIQRNGMMIGGAVGAGLASVGGYAGFKRLRSDDAERSDADESERTDPTRPSAADVDPISDLPTPSIRQPDLSATTYDDFDVEEMIGSGGSADVNRATVEVDDREHTVALKTPRMSDYETVDTDFFEEFVQEAEIWENIDDHETIVSVLGWGQQPYPWIALEYMEAGNLEELLDDLDTETALAHLEAICDGVHHAHRHGVTHTDLKPENVLYTTADERLVPKVTDWGLANVLIEHSTTVDGMTPAYAAPEQIEPNSYGGTDDRTDIYQLGVIAYELLTGQRPFDYDNYTATMNAILNDTPTSPAELNEAIDPDLSDAILRALEKDKDQRYETALHFRDALRRSYHEGQR